MGRSNIDPVAAAKLVKVLAHPLRIEILKLYDEHPRTALSPTMLVGLFAEKGIEVPLPNLSYHMRMLTDLGALRLHKTRPKRGAVEHLYLPAPVVRAALDLFAAIEPEEVAA